MGSDGSRVRPRKGGVTKGLKVGSWVGPRRGGVTRRLGALVGSRVGPRRGGVTRRLGDVALVRPGGVTNGHVSSDDVTMGHDGGGEGMDSARLSRW